MCIVSMVHDFYYDEWKDRAPWEVLPTHPNPYYPITPEFPYPQPAKPKKTGPVTQEEIEEFRRLLDRAREYDKKNNQPDCGLDEKRKKIKELADKLGIEIDFV